MTDAPSAAGDDVSTTGGTGREDEVVHYAVDGPVATITLDSPRNRNALSRALVGQLSDRLETADADPQVRVVVLTAEGPAFCSGADLSEAASGGMVEGAKGLVAIQRRILTLGVPVVVRLHGPVRAGGLGIVAAADVVLAAESVTFAFTEVRLGLAPSVISLTTLPRMTSRGAAETFLSAAPFPAQRAAQLGLITRAVPDAELDVAVTSMVEELGHGVRQGQRETKALLNAGIVAAIDRDGDDLARRSAALFASDEARAAMRAFLERARR